MWWPSTQGVPDGLVSTPPPPRLASSFTSTRVSTAQLGFAQFLLAELVPRRTCRPATAEPAKVLSSLDPSRCRLIVASSKM